jgi:ABC-type branched-subunit amino acid transport system ATPase component
MPTDTARRLATLGSQTQVTNNAGMTNGASTNGTAALRVSDLRCSFGGNQAVRGVTFDVAAGSLVGLIGPNGAGKSTLIDCISGRHTAYQGQVFALGHEITRLPMYKVARLGIVRNFQVARPFRKLSVLSNLMYGPRGQRGERLERALIGGWKGQEAELLESARASMDVFGLGAEENNLGSELSGGQERLVELCRAVMCQPRVLLLDEPFAGVSPVNRKRLADRLKALVAESGMTILMVEHRLEWVERLCSRILVMAEGTVILDGTMQEVRSNARVIEAYLGPSPE